MTELYYYDETAAKSEDGSLTVPEIVYNQNGQPVLLASLQAGQVLMQPPAAGSSMQQSEQQQQQASAPSLGATASSSTSGTRRKVFGPPPEDEYIIIGTVLVMALLVGALSARRMRARSHLGFCIENEQLDEEEEVTYDNLSTTAYNTFGGGSSLGSWKGDLEKFDV